ncbi:hypothetical protein GPECTOR_159g108 [Gonium pectorale]|uniref:Uncharacterized protein n=1 Tax=Gonium pectorale TaxID=33097 RepID=A0A150FZ57_GONPE|nr:hypothetical protein GPECTOR_159g108 [Gonium pectorale]|eukprot:KXZ42340.1 hypothetical protein GPECTOR_159g108 [Gonium pectorale]
MRSSAPPSPKPGEWNTAVQPIAVGDYKLLKTSNFFCGVNGVSCGAARPTSPFPAKLKRDELSVVVNPFTGVWGVTGEGVDGKWHTFISRSVKREWPAHCILEGLAWIDADALYISPVFARSFTREELREQARVHLGLSEQYACSSMAGSSHACNKAHGSRFPLPAHCHAAR